MAAGAESAGPVTSLLWGPVVVVTSAAATQRSGQLAISCIAASVVPGRPRLLASLWKLNLTHDLVAASGALALHTLRRDQIDLVEWFGLQSGRTIDKFAGRAWEPNAAGVPILVDCLGWCAGRVVNALDGGDMTTFLIDIMEGELLGPASELLTWPDLRDRLDPALAARIAAKRANELDWNRTHLDRLAGPFYRP